MPYDNYLLTKNEYKKINNLKILSFTLAMLLMFFIPTTILLIVDRNNSTSKNQISISEYIDLEEIAYEYSTSQDYYIYRDKNTNTLYLQIKYSGGMTMTPIINPDGTAKLYEGE